MAGINYTVYYTDYEAMVEDDRGEQRFQVGRSVLNYRSSHDWVKQPGVMDAGLTSGAETLLYHCLALGVQCASPTPTPAPGPSDACEKTIDQLCPVGTVCEQCIPSHAQALISAGCPPAEEGGAEACIDYCNSRGQEMIV